MYASHSLLCSAQTTGDFSHSQRGRLTACLDVESIEDNTENNVLKIVFENMIIVEMHAKWKPTLSEKTETDGDQFLTVSLLLLLLTMDSGVRICLRLFIFACLDVYSPS